MLPLPLLSVLSAERDGLCAYGEEQWDNHACMNKADELVWTVYLFDRRRLFNRQPWRTLLKVIEQNTVGMAKKKGSYAVS